MGAGPKCIECDAPLGGGGPAWSYHGSQGPKHDDVRSCLNEAGMRVHAALDRAMLAERRKRDAERLADEVQALVASKIIDERSPAADALLDYRDPDPMRSARGERITALEEQVEAMARARDEALDRELNALRAMESAIGERDATRADAAVLRRALIAHVDHFGGVHSHPDDCGDLANCEEHKLAALVDNALGSNGGKNHVEERDILRAECGRLKASCAEIAEESSRHEAAAEALREALMLVTDDGANGPNEAWQAFVHEEDCSWREGDEDDDDRCDGRYIVRKVLAALAADVGKSILREMANLQREVEAQKKRASAMLVVAAGCVEAVKVGIENGDAAASRFQAEVGEWAAATFPRSDDHAKIAHLKKEVAELEAHVCAEEAADCFLILLHIANAHDFDLAAAAREKFAVLKTRAWGEPDADGVVEHVRDVPRERGESGGGR